MQKKHSVPLTTITLVVLLQSSAMAQYDSGACYCSFLHTSGLSVTPPFAIPPEGVPGSISISPKDHKRPLSYWQQQIAHFLDGYFRSRYGEYATPLLADPPSESLDCVQGYVTGTDRYWEQEEIRFDDFQIIGNKLQFKCFITGKYVKLKSPYIYKERLNNAIDLQKDYREQLTSRCTCLMDTLQKFLTPPSHAIRKS
ncbi:MAG TPA: hypothetical protein VNW04_14095 [Puia sp.]|jgi:hypothetical protein|nr:hypothetical protein [Puia sp.]